MLDEERIVHLEAQVRSLKKLFVVMEAILIAVLSIGAVTGQDQSIRGKLSILAGDGTPKTVFYQDGRIEIGGRLIVDDKGQFIVDKKDLSTVINDLKQEMNTCVKSSKPYYIRFVNRTLGKWDLNLHGNVMTQGQDVVIARPDQDHKWSIEEAL